jgi:S1-C subfamily serine protease
MSSRTARGARALAVIAIFTCGCHRREARAPGHAPPSPTTKAAPIPPANQQQAAGVTPKLAPSPQAQALSDAFEAVAKAIRPCVVRIDVEEAPSPVVGQTELNPDVPDFLRRFFREAPDEAPQAGPRRIVRGTGAGVIVDARGDVITNSHVVRGARKVTIQLPDQRAFPAVVVGADPLTDVAVVRFERAPSGLVAARVGDSDKLHIGQWSIAFGSPLGMDQTVTAGIVSAVGETGTRFRFESGERVRKYIQTDAKINPGNSGGPLVNLEGEVVGINTLINVGPGGSYGFAIPINQAWQIAGILIKEGRVRYPFIGVSVMTLSPALRAQLAERAPDLANKLPKDGALVGGVTLDGPAANAGLQVGDIITRVDGRAVKNAEDLVSDLSEHGIGTTVHLDYWRNGGIRPVDLKVGEYPSEQPQPSAAAPPPGQAPPPPTGPAPAHLGVALQTLTPALAAALELDTKLRGALITEVLPGTPGERAGLSVGDAIGTRFVSVSPQ